MFDKVNLINILAITICFAMSAESYLVHVLRPRIGFKIYDNDVPIQYYIDVVKLEYNNNDLELNRQGVKAEINIKKAIVQFMEGKDRDEIYPQYSLPRGSTFQVVVKGTGIVTEDERGVIGCEFTYSEKDDAPIVGMSKKVKEGILSSLPRLNRELCRKIKFQ